MINLNIKITKIDDISDMKLIEFIVKIIISDCIEDVFFVFLRRRKIYT